MVTTKNVWEKIKSSFYLDLRSLALFRVLFALAMIIDLIRRSAFLELHYTAWGVYPPSSVDTATRYCLHCISGSTQFQAFLFILAGLVNFSLMIGYRTRLSAIISFILLCSLQNRNHYVMDGSDDYTRVALFWAIFLPLNKYYSIDSLKLNKKKRSSNTGQKKMTVMINDGPDQIAQDIIINNEFESLDIQPEKEVEEKKKTLVNQVVTVATVGYIIQFFYIYYFTARLKYGPTWHEDYTSVYLALSLLEFRFRLAQTILQYKGLVMFLCRVTLVFEYLGPVFIFSPIFNSALRFVSILGFIGMHLGFGACLNLYQFIYIPMIVALAFLPSVFWDRAREYFLESPRKKENEITIHYYHHQSRNNTPIERFEVFLKIFKTLFLEPFMKVKEVRHTNYPGKETFSVQYKNETVYDYYDSLQLLLKNSFLLFPLGNKYIYNNIFTKYIVTKLFSYIGGCNDYDCEEEPLNESPKPKKKSFYKQYKHIIKRLVKYLCIYVIIYSYYYNSITLSSEKGEQVSPTFVRPFTILKMDQYWGMFAPDPPTFSRWTMISGNFEKSGYQDIDMLKDDLSTKINLREKPPYLFTSGQRFRNYITNAAYFEPLKLNFGRYICRTFNIYNPPNEERGKLLSLKIYIVSVNTIPFETFYKAQDNKELLEFIESSKHNSSYEVVWDHVC